MMKMMKRKLAKLLSKTRCLYSIIYDFMIYCNIESSRTVLIDVTEHMKKMWNFL